jgi:hypothetical protein
VAEGAVLGHTRILLDERESIAVVFVATMALIRGHGRRKKAYDLCEECATAAVFV